MKSILKRLREKYPQAVRVEFDGEFYHVTGRDRQGEFGLVRANLEQVKNLLGLRDQGAAK